MRRGVEGPAGETGGQGGNDPGQKTHLEDVLPSPLHIQGVIHLPYRIPGANRSLLILTLLLSFHSFVYPVPLPEETYKPFSWSPVVLPQMIHSQNSPLADMAVSRQDLTKPFGLVSPCPLGKSSRGPHQCFVRSGAGTIAGSLSKQQNEFASTLYGFAYSFVFLAC